MKPKHTFEHEALTTQFVPRSDLVLFVTSADRPFAETERRFLEQIRAWGKKVVLIINKIDLLAREEDVAKVVGFVGESAKRLFGIVPAIFPVSAREALRAKLGEPARLTSSRFQPLEEYLNRRRINQDVLVVDEDVSSTSSSMKPPLFELPRFEQAGQSAPDTVALSRVRDSRRGPDVRASDDLVFRSRRSDSRWRVHPGRGEALAPIRSIRRTERTRHAGSA